MVLLQLKDPLELFVKRRKFLPGSGFLSHRDINELKGSLWSVYRGVPWSDLGGVATIISLPPQHKKCTAHY